jgi:hypothetical protein
VADHVPCESQQVLRSSGMRRFRYPGRVDGETETNMLGHLIYTYDRLDDARVQQEISKRLYSAAFGGVHLVHAYNGKKEFGYAPYLEDKLIVRQNRGHYRGAVDLINAGLAWFNVAGLPEVRYVLITAADTWAVDVPFLQSVVMNMEAHGRVLATSSWRTAQPAQIHGFSLDFFIVDLQWNARASIFPLDYDAFYDRYADILALLYSPPIAEVALQHAFQCHFLSTYVDNSVLIERNRQLLRIAEREPACIRENARGRTQTGIWHSHGADEKRALLSAAGLDCGPHCRRLIDAEDCSYFNGIPAAPLDLRVAVAP